MDVVVGAHLLSTQSLSTGAPDGMFTAGTTPIFPLRATEYGAEFAWCTTLALRNQYPPAGPISESDFFRWEALIVGPKDTPFEGGVFPAILTFVRTVYVRRAKLSADRSPSVSIFYRIHQLVLRCHFHGFAPGHLHALVMCMLRRPPAFRLPSIPIQDEV